jgi:hypothetical protein
MEGTPGGLVAQGERRIGREVSGGKMTCLKTGPGSCGNHGCIISGKSQSGEGDGEVAALGLGGKARAELAVGGDSAGDENSRGADGLLCGEGFLEQVSDDSTLEAGNEVEGLRIAGGEGGFDGGAGGRVWPGKERFASGLCFRA